MSTQIIKAFPERHRIPIPDDPGRVLDVAEFYCDTIQGEGVNTGAPAAFLRLQGCVLDCIYCDATEVWRVGNPYSFDELFLFIEKADLIYKFRQGQHLICTGGSPLKQQWNLFSFFEEFVKKYQFLPYLEIENECVLRPLQELTEIVNCWNNSPKLVRSMNSKRARYKPSILKYMSELKNSWFKFVIECPEDWQEIQMDFLDPRLIDRNQIILMPMGMTREELFKNQKMTAEMAIKHNVRYSSREHIVLWDKKVGV